MVNYLRTLLLNQDGPAPTGEPGEEYIPANYRKVTLSPALLSVRAALFGPDPDRRMLLYRTRQFLAILHSVPLAPFVAAADSRITYSLDAEPTLLPSLQVTGSQEPLYVTGGPLEATPAGQLAFKWMVTVGS